jgi:hypothetical protein
MALANVRERLALHFDAEASLDSRVTKEGYEVHIRIPYRVAGPDAAPEPHAPGASRRNGRSAEPGSGSKRAAVVARAIALSSPEASRV